MLPALEGRINRKTYMAANLIAFGLLIIACGIIVVPIAILDIVANGSRLSDILSYFYFLVGLPVFLYAFYFSVLMVKRAHDFNSPGILWVAGFFVAQIIGRYFDLYIFNLLCLIIIAFFCAKAGSKGRNTFGPRPRDKFRTKDLKVTF